MSSGRRVWITGVSSGIGAATAKALAQQGWRVAGTARRQEPLERLAAELPGDGHLLRTADVREDGDLQAVAQEIAAEFGGLDLMVANAGVGYRAKVEEFELDPLRAVLDTNVLGVLLTCRAALPLLRTGERPVCVLVSSVVGRRGIPGQSAYAASKAAVCSIGEALRIEWAPDEIEVCTLNPALTATGFFDAQPNPASLPDPDMRESAQPLDVAQAILALSERPRPEVHLRWKWRVLGAINALAPSLADRLLVKRLGGGWRAPLGRR